MSFWRTFLITLNALTLGFDVGGLIIKPASQINWTLMGWSIGLSLISLLGLLSLTIVEHLEKR